MVELFTTRDSLEDGLSAAVAIRLPGVGGVVIGTETGVEAAGVVGAGMGVLGAGVDGAGVDGAGVLGAVEILPLSGVSSINGGRIPVALGRRPEALGRTPEVLGKMPEVLGKMPDVLGKMPEVLGKMPEVLAKAPDTLGRMPEVLGTMGPLGLIRALAGSSGRGTLGVAGCLFSLCSFSLNTEVSLNTTALITPLICSSGQHPSSILWGRPRPFGRMSPGSLEGPSRL